MNAPTELHGSCDGGLVRTIYVDEAGTSKDEPVTVVVAVLIHGDTQYRPTLRHLRYLRDIYAPESQRSSFVFHATDIWHSAKPFGGDEAAYPFSRRVRIIKRLVSISRKQNLSVAYGFIRNVARVSDDPQYRHLTAFVLCLQQIARLISEKFPKEMASLVIEDHPSAKEAIRAIHTKLRGDNADESMVKDLMEELYFAKKSEAPLLQLADGVAFPLRRCLGRFNLGDELASAVAPDASLDVFRGGDYGAGFATEQSTENMLPLKISF
jgi:hypothetical protein